MLTVLKHCYDMEGPTQNAEHINRFSILFSWAKNSNNKDDDAWKAILIFRIVGEQGEYALFKCGMLLYYRETK